MKNLILKYILFLLLFFVTTKLSASNNPVDIWKEVSLKDEMNWLIFSDKFNMKSDNTAYFFVDGQYFSLVCLNDTYYRKSGYIVYRLKNIGIEDINTVDKVNIGLKFQVSKTNLGDIIGGINESLTSLPLNLSAIYLDVGESVDFSFKENAPSSVSEGQNATFNLTLTYGRAGSSLNINNSDRLESLTLNTVLTQNSNLPVVLSNQILPNIQYTLQTALNLTDSQLLNKTFYKNGVIFNPRDLLSLNKLLTQEDINGFTYSVDGSNLKAKVLLYFPHDFPYGGKITSSTPIINNNYQVCYNGSISLIESQRAQSYRSKAFKYTWEFSYDRGVTWHVYGDTQATEGETIDSGSKTLSISNLKRDVLVRRKAHESVTTTSANRYYYSYSNIISINVVNPVLLYNGKAVNDTPKGSNGIAKVMGYVIEFPTFTVRNGNGVLDPLAKISVYNENGTLVAQNFSGTGTGNGTLTIPNRTFPTKGFYKYKVVIQEGSGLQCSYTEYYNVTIYEPSDCNKYTQKIFATINLPLLPTEVDGVVNGNLAVDKDLSTKSTISAALTALYLGPRQKVKFDLADFPGVSGVPIKAGTVIKIKLGQEYSGLNLAGGISLYPLTSDGGRIGGHVDAVEGALLDLLVGDKIFEYSYVAPVDLYGVEVYVGGLLGAAVNASLYGVYIERDVNIANNDGHCLGNVEIKGAALPLSSTIYNNVDTGEPITFPANGIIRLNETVSDVCWGVQDIGLGVATALASVVYPYLAVDDSYETYAIFNKTVAALNRQFLDVKFNQLGRQGDQIQILLSNSGIDILSLNLLSDFKAQRYLGDTPVGDEISLNNTALVKLSLLWMDGRRRAAIIVWISP